MITAIHSKEFSSPVTPAAGSVIPREIQWMPPGEHEITASQGSERITSKIRVNARTADAMQRFLDEARAKAAAGQGDLPYIDFNHDDREAAGFITAFRWGGDDPLNGGVIAAIEWTGPGKAALQGRAYRRFSPSFYPPNADGEVTQAPLNMGGLVNRAAFKSIKPIVAGGPGDTKENKRMEGNTEKLAADLAAAQQKIVDLTKQLDTSTHTQAITAKDAEITTLKAKVTELETAAKEQIKLDAKAAVAVAIEAGKLAPKDEDTHKHYEALYIANPEATRSIIAKMKPDPALSTVIIHASGKPGTEANGQPGEHQFVVKARAYANEHKTTWLDASRAISAKEPQLYADYCKSLTPKN